MELKKPRQSELQSKTVILPDTEEVEKTLNTLKQGGTKPTSSPQSFDWLTIVIIILLIFVAVEVLWILLR